MQEILKKLIAKMILADEKIHPAEVNFFKNLSVENDLDNAATKRLFEEAKAKSLEELVLPVKKYEDRLFIVQQAYYVAHCDKDYALSEMKMFDEMIKLFGIKKDDIKRIESSAATLIEGRYDIFFNPDISYLHNNFMQSSFFIRPDETKGI